MKFHEIVAIGPIYVHKVATEPSWTIADLARLIYTIDNDQLVYGGNTGWMTLCTLNGNQVISGIKTFNTLPLLNSDPTDGKHPVRKSYLVSYGQGNFVDMTSNQTIGGKKTFLQNPAVSGYPLEDNDVANKEYVDDNFVDLSSNQTIGGIKTFTTIPVGPNINPTTDNQLARKRYVDDQVASAGSAKAKITSGDSTPGYLESKLVAGSGCTLAVIGAPGTNQTLRISLTPTSSGADPGQVYASETDTVAGFLSNKLTAGTGITLTLSNPSGDEHIEIAYSGTETRYITYDFEYTVGASEYGKTLTCPAPDITKAKNICRDTTNNIRWSAYDHPVSETTNWTITPDEDIVVETRWTSLFPFCFYNNSGIFVYSTLNNLLETVNWKTYKNCTTYNNGSPDGTSSDWDFFPLFADYIYVPFDSDRQTYSNRLYTPGFNMSIPYTYYARAFGSNYKIEEKFAYTNAPYIGDEWFQLCGHGDTVGMVAPTWILGCTPAPVVETNVSMYASLSSDDREPRFKKYTGFIPVLTWKYYDQDSEPFFRNKIAPTKSDRYVVLKAGTSYTFKLRSIFGLRLWAPYGYTSTSAFWYSSTVYDIGYRPGAVGNYDLHSIWELYQGAGKTKVRLKGIAKSSIPTII